MFNADVKVWSVGTHNTTGKQGNLSSNVETAVDWKKHKYSWDIYCVPNSLLDFIQNSFTHGEQTT